WDNKYKNNNGWSHAWSASPAHILPRKVMGIQPAAAGFRLVAIRPRPAGLEWAKAKLPTIRGPIEAAFEAPADRFKLTVSLPANTQGNVYLPIPDAVNVYKLTHNGTAVTAVQRNQGYLMIRNVGSGNHVFELNYY